jgi:hypothetical protein
MAQAEHVTSSIRRLITGAKISSSTNGPLARHVPLIACITGCTRSPGLNYWNSRRTSETLQLAPGKSWRVA